MAKPLIWNGSGIVQYQLVAADVSGLGTIAAYAAGDYLPIGGGTLTGALVVNGGDVTINCSSSFSPTTGRRYLAIKGQGGTSFAGVFQAAHGATDANSTIVGNYEFIDPNQSSTSKRVGYIGAVLNGTTGNARGADLIFATRKNNDTVATEVLRLCRNGATSSDATEGVFAFDYPSFSGSGAAFGTFGAATRSVILDLNGSAAADKASGLTIRDASTAWNMTVHNDGKLRWSHGLLAAGQTDSTIAGSTAMTLEGGGTGASDTVLTLNGLTATLKFGDKGRIRGDFQHATRANRTLFQNTGTTGGTALGVIPAAASGSNGTVQVYNAADPDNAGFTNLQPGTITTGKTGTGTAPNLTLAAGGFSTFTLSAIDGSLNFGALLTNYNGNALTGNGVPILLLNKAYTAQTAAIAATNLIASLPADGMYRITYNANITRAATTSSTLGGTAATGFLVTYTDPTDSVAKTTKAIAGDNDTRNTTAAALYGVKTAYGKAATALQFSFDYLSSGATTMQFDLFITVEYLGACT